MCSDSVAPRRTFSPERFPSTQAAARPWPGVNRSRVRLAGQLPCVRSGAAGRYDRPAVPGSGKRGGEARCAVPALPFLVLASADTPVLNGPAPGGGRGTIPCEPAARLPCDGLHRIFAFPTGSDAAHGRQRVCPVRRVQHVHDRARSHARIPILSMFSCAATVVRRVGGYPVITGARNGKARSSDALQYPEY